MADSEFDGRRGFLKKAGAGAAALAAENWSSLIRKAQAGENPAGKANDAIREKPIVHLPDAYLELRELSEEQKQLIMMCTLSGCDAVAYYTKLPNVDKGFGLNKHIDLYRKQDTEFAKEINIAADAKEGVIQGGKNHNERVFYIPIKGDKPGEIKGIVALHAPKGPQFSDKTNNDDKREPEYCQLAKVDMARYVAEKHSGLFGCTTQSQVNEKLEKLHMLENKKEFFLGLVKRMYRTFTNATNKGLPLDPTTRDPVWEAKTAEELIEALRNTAKISNSEQYTHVLGVAEGAGCIIDAVNKAAQPVYKFKDGELFISKEQKELFVIRALLHDIGKVQIPSQMMRTGWKDHSLEDELLGVSRNGSHPLFTLTSLLTYWEDGIRAAEHHHGIDRYGPDERKAREERLRDPNKSKFAQAYIANFGDKKFDDFTELKNGDNVKPEALSVLTRALRLFDITERVTGDVIKKPLHDALKELSTKKTENDSGVSPLFRKVQENDDGTFKITPDTISPPELCLMLKNDAFNAYGNMRREKDAEWKAKYDETELSKMKEKTLVKFKWKDEGKDGLNPTGEALEKQLLEEIKKDPLRKEKLGHSEWRAQAEVQPAGGWSEKVATASQPQWNIAG